MRGTSLHPRVAGRRGKMKKADFRQIWCQGTVRRLGQLWAVVWSWLEQNVQPCTASDAQVLTSRMRLGIMLRFNLWAVSIVVAFVFLFSHVYQLQVRRHIEIDSKALGVYRSYRQLPAQRGKIYDSTGSLLACDLATYDLLVEPGRFVPRLPEVIELAEHYLQLDRDQLALRFSQAVNYAFPCQVSESADALAALRLEKEKLPHVTWQKNAPEAENKYTIVLYPAGLDKKQLRDCIERLSVISGVEVQQIEQRAAKALGRFREIPLLLNASLDAATNFMAAVSALEINKKKITGIRAVESWQRSYPRDHHLANMLGYLDNERRGISGIEAMFDDIMTAKPGKLEFRRDVRGRPLPGGRIVVRPPRNGANIHLTIVSPLQQIMEEKMRLLVEKYRPEHAYALMLNRQTGAVMAAVQYPQFNPNDRNTMLPENIPNHALYKCYEPGSIMKGLSIACAIENRCVSLDSEYDCEHGHWRYGGRALRDTHGYGVLSVAKIIQKSSNIGTAKIALDMGEELTSKGLAAFCLGQPTGVGFYPAGEKPRVFANESRGLFKPLKYWDTLTVTRMPIGQGVSMTPWQIIQAWSALANGGVMMQPYIVEKVVYPDGHTVYSQPHCKATPISRETAQIMTSALKLVTQKEGTGRSAAVKGYEIAGKTGTAQIWVPADPVSKSKGYYSNSMNFSSFVGFAPADNPAFVLLVSVENPKGSFRTGGVVCGETFASIAKSTLEYLQIPPQLDLAEESDEQRRLKTASLR